MALEEKFRARLALKYDPALSRRYIGGREAIIHCHHYNSRLQRTIEQAEAIDGKAIIRSSAEGVFADYLAALCKPGDTEADKWRLAEALYAHLGFGRLDFSRVKEGSVVSPSSHFVEGWNAGFKGRTEPVCTFACGYIQAAVRAVTGERVAVTEEECMIGGAETCRFSIRENRSEEVPRLVKKSFTPPPAHPLEPVRSNIDEKKIISALIEMPIHGDDEGLIPAFNVYLANMPGDFYNLICIRFIEEMQRQNLGTTAKRLLYFDAETCGMTTFRGILHSPEWEGLVAPMIREPRDTLFGLVAVSNALGWGRWQITAYEPGKSVSLQSLNGYEAYGYRELRGVSPNPQCPMLAGVSAGMMELVTLQGTLESRFGTFYSDEHRCIACEDDSCRFDVKKT